MIDGHSSVTSRSLSHVAAILLFRNSAATVLTQDATTVVTPAPLSQSLLVLVTTAVEECTTATFLIQDAAAVVAHAPLS